MAKFRLHFVISKLTELHCDMLVSILIFIFPFFSALIFLLGFNYRNKIYLFEKLSIFLNFKEVTQQPYCEANFANPYVTVRMLRYIKFVHNLKKKMHLVLQKYERFGIFGMSTEHYLAATTVYVRRRIVIVRRIYLIFLSVIEHVHVLLKSDLNYLYTSFFSRYLIFL